MSMSEPLELQNDDAYQAVKQSNSDRLQVMRSKGGNVNIDLVYTTSLLEFMIVGQDLMSDALRFHQGRLANMLDEFEVMQDAAIEEMEEMRRKAVLLNGNNQVVPPGPQAMTANGLPGIPKRPH